MLTLGPLLACASVILRTGLQPSTLRERCRGLSLVSFGEVLYAQGTHQVAQTSASAAVGPDVPRVFTRSCDWFRHGSRRTNGAIAHCAQVMGAMCASSVIMPRATGAHALSLPLLGEGSLFLPRTYQRSRPRAEHALTPTVIKGMATVLFTPLFWFSTAIIPTRANALSLQLEYSSITAGIFQL